LGIQVLRKPYASLSRGYSEGALCGGEKGGKKNWPCLKGMQLSPKTMYPSENGRDQKKKMAAKIADYGKHLRDRQIEVQIKKKKKKKKKNQPKIKILRTPISEPKYTDCKLESVGLSLR